MSFTSEIKQEILLHGIENTCCETAFLAAVVFSCGSIGLKDKKLILTLECEKDITDFIADKFFKLFSIELINSGEKKDRLNGINKVVLKTGDEKLEYALSELNVLNREGPICEDRCCRINFLRGVFAACGRVILPSFKNSGYMLKLSLQSVADAKDVLETMNSFEFNAKLHSGGKAGFIYIKNSQSISDFLAFLNAEKSVLNFNRLLVERDISNNINRISNFENANIGKTAAGAVLQIRAICKIDEAISLKNLEPKLKAVAEARLENTEDSLEELAGRLNLTKSCVSHRMRKIIEIYNKL